MTVEYIKLCNVHHCCRLQSTLKLNWVAAMRLLLNNLLLGMIFILIDNALSNEYDGKAI